MKNTKIVSVLRSFSQQEVKKFRDFVKSPYYNKNKNVIQLNEALLKFYPEFSSDKLTEEHLYILVFGKEKFDYFKIKNISSDLYNLVLEFLKIQPDRATSFYKDYNLLIQVRTRKLFKLHKKMVKQLEGELEDTEIKDTLFNYENYLLSKESQFVDLFEKPSSITGIIKEFDLYFEYLISGLLEYYNLLIHISKENNIRIDPKMLDEIVSYLEKGPVSQNPATLSNQYLILMKVKDNEEYYFKLKNFYLEHFNEMSVYDAFKTHMHMFGYCADMYNFKGDRRFIQEGYELFKHSYENGRVRSGELLYPDFVNFIKVFARAGDIELARKFIGEHKHLLTEDQLDNSLNFSNAYIAHREGQLSKALAYIVKVNFPLAILKVQVKILEIQLNFELGYYEETRELMESFKKTLQREVIVSDDYKNSILNFLRNTAALINVIEETSPNEIRYMLDKLESDMKEQQNHFGIKFWLEDRIHSIKQTARK